MEEIRQTNKRKNIMAKPLLNTYQYYSNFHFEYVTDF